MSFFGKVKEGAAKAAEKAKETVELTRLSAQISSKKKEIDKLNQSIGETVFQAYLSEDFLSSEPSVIALCRQITDVNQEITALEQKIKELKNEKDCVCGASLPVDTNFCPTCGYKFAPRVHVEEAPLERLGSVKDEDQEK
ncbi:zinc ribbon domain-containing protein [Paenibacillus sp. KN14-4R]|uniref:zinc ribbon domain-containing protein n=1 Tax=Paenibacillus sp. KN14-4R TaxID=3445773 RepID=UPI003FA13BBF